MARFKGKGLSPEEKEQRKEVLLQQVEDVINNFETSPETILDYLKFSSRFHQYSENNTILIYEQNSMARFCASYKALQDMGYQVQKGEIGMKIFVPYISTMWFDEASQQWSRLADASKEIKERISAGEIQTKQHTTFGIGTVFEIGQTNCPPEDYPKVCDMGFSSESHARLYNALVNYAESRNISVTEKSLPSITTRGYFNRADNSITLSDKLNDSMKVSVMSHELAHAIMHGSEDAAEISRFQKEIEGDSLSLMFRQHLGITDIEDVRQKHLQDSYKQYVDMVNSSDSGEYPSLSQILDNVHNAYLSVVYDFNNSINNYLDLHPDYVRDFSNKIDSFLEGTLNPYEQVFVCNSTSVMKACGAPDLPVMINQGKIRTILSSEPDTKSKHNHNLNVSTLKQLPLQLEKPIMVFKGSHDKSMVLVTDIQENNHEVLIAVEIDTTGFDGQINRVSSMYPKEHINNYLRLQIEKGNLIGCQKEKANEMLSIKGLQLPPTTTFIDYTNIISNNSEKVNSKNLKQEIIEFARAEMKVEENLKIYSPEKLTQSGVFMQGIEYALGKAAFEKGYEITVDEINEMKYEVLGLNNQNVEYDSEIISDKPSAARIFVDMDGTLAEWNYVEKSRLYEKGYYRTLEPNQQLLNDVKNLLANGENVYVLSAYLTDSEYALEEKQAWLQEHLSELPSERQIFVPYGTNKAEFLKDNYSPITSKDYLVDDYTKNLNEWQEFGGVGIKYLNGINHTKGTWQGLMVSYDKEKPSLSDVVLNEQKASSQLLNSQITLNMSEEQRTRILRDKTVTVVINSNDESSVDYYDYENKAKSKIEKPLKNKMRELGVFKEYNSNSIDIVFQFTSGGFNKSLNSQIDYGGSFSDFAKVLVNLDELLNKSVLIETHTDKAAGTPLQNHQLKQVYVLSSALAENSSIIPVQFEVMEYKNNSNRLYLTVAMGKIKETDVLEDTAHNKNERTLLLSASNNEVDVMGNTVNAVSEGQTSLLSTSTINITQLFKNINPVDSNFLKYIPNEFLNKEQLNAKTVAIQKDERKYGKMSKEIAFEFDGEIVSIVDKESGDELFPEENMTYNSYDEYLLGIARVNPQYSDYINDNLNQLSSDWESVMVSASREAKAVELSQLDAALSSGGFGEDSANQRASDRISTLKSELDINNSEESSIYEYLDNSNELPIDVLCNESKIKWVSFACSINDIDKTKEVLNAIQRESRQVVAITDGHFSDNIKPNQIVCLDESFVLHMTDENLPTSYDDNNRPILIKPYDSMIYPSVEAAQEKIWRDPKIAKQVTLPQMVQACAMEDLSPLSEAENQKFPYVKVNWSENAELTSHGYLNFNMANSLIEDVNEANQQEGTHEKANLSLFLDGQTSVQVDLDLGADVGGLTEHLNRILQETDLPSDTSLQTLKDFLKVKGLLSEQAAAVSEQATQMDIENSLIT